MRRKIQLIFFPRFHRGLDKLYDILDSSWMTAVTGNLYKVSFIPYHTILPQTIRTLLNDGMKSLNHRQKNFATTGQLESGMLWLKTISLFSRSWSVFSVSFPAGGMDVSVTQSQAGDGWQELCSFLKKPIPETPYPRYRNVKI